MLRMFEGVRVWFGWVRWSDLFLLGMGLIVLGIVVGPWLSIIGFLIVLGWAVGET